MTLLKKRALICIFSIISTILLLPILRGITCNTEFSYETSTSIVTGYCKLGIINAYLLPKNKNINDNYYLSIKGVYMKLKNNSAVYIYHIDGSHIPYNINNIRLINKLKYKRYHQFHTEESSNQLITNNDNGQLLRIKLHDVK